MKRLFTTAIMVMAVMVLAGCASAQTGGNTNTITAPILAAQLAAEFNAMSEASATASGGTVTLTENVWIENSLTVPEGVTLDLTKKGVKFTLKDGVTLTVDGTVNIAGHGFRGDVWEEGSLFFEDGTNVINGNGTIYVKNDGCLFNFDGGNKLILDGVTMVGVSGNTNSLINFGSGSEVVMKSGLITGNSSGVGGGVGVYSGGTFTMEGGTISGNSTTIRPDGLGGQGGGVRIWQGTFIMKGGVISGNSATAGGGVGIVGGNGSTFIMEGGTIYGNSADGGNANTATRSAAVSVDTGMTAKWGTGGTYTIGGVNQTGGGNIASTNDTLIAIPAR